MASNPLHSHRRGLLKKAGVALLWACCFGGLFGAAVSFRVDREGAPGRRPALARGAARLARAPRAHQLRLALPRARRPGRAHRRRGAGRRSTRRPCRTPGRTSTWSGAPTPGRASSRSRWRRRRRGRARRSCTSAPASPTPRRAPRRRRASTPRRATISRRRRWRRKLAGPIVLPFDWSAQRTRPAERPLAPFLVRVAEAHDAQGAIGAVRDVLMLRARAWLVPDEGKVVLWAGAPSEAKARELAQRLDVKGPLVLRNLTPGRRGLRRRPELAGATARRGAGERARPFGAAGGAHHRGPGARAVGQDRRARRRRAGARRRRPGARGAAAGPGGRRRTGRPRCWRRRRCAC